MYDLKLVLFVVFFFWCENFNNEDVFVDVVGSIGFDCDIVCVVFVSGECVEFVCEKEWFWMFCGFIGVFVMIFNC